MVQYQYLELGAPAARATLQNTCVMEMLIGRRNIPGSSPWEPRFRGESVHVASVARRATSLHVVPVPEIDTPAAMLLRLAVVGDEAGLTKAFEQLDGPTLADALERITLAHEAAALSVRDGSASRVVDYRTALLLGIRELSRRASGTRLGVATRKVWPIRPCEDLMHVAAPKAHCLARIPSLLPKHERVDHHHRCPLERIVLPRADTKKVLVLPSYISRSSCSTRSRSSFPRARASRASPFCQPTGGDR